MASSFQPITAARDGPRGQIPDSPSFKHQKWEYLNSLEATPKKSRWEYLNSLDLQPMPVDPNVTFTPDHQSAVFYDEAVLVDDDDHRRATRMSSIKYKVCNGKPCTILTVLLVATVIVTSIVLGVQHQHHIQSERSASLSLGVSATVYETNQDILVTATVSSGNAKSSDWVGIWQAEKVPGMVFTVSDTPPAMWMNLCDPDESSGSGPSSCSNEIVLTFAEGSGWESEYVGDWPLCDGKWVACAIESVSANDDDGSEQQNLACSEVFVVVGGTCDGVCRPATSTVSKIQHLNPTPKTPLSKIAFGSCFDPERQVDSRLWAHMREEFQPDLWVWLGDNARADGEDMEVKRATYNANKEDLYYLQYGPLADPMIPVAGTWDDHDSGVAYSGAEYQCHKLAQDEFAYWFNLPDDDPRHPAQGSNQRKGVYSSVMFSTPNDTDVNGVHLILLDARYHRSPVFKENGYCQGANSTMLGYEQWKWLGHELKKKSKVKVIGTSIQVMQPTDQFFTDVDTYCANDNATFLDAIEELEETERHLGTEFETWGQIPQEKMRLLRYLQRSINDGFTEKIIIISGNMQWAEVMAKKIPATKDYGDSQVIFEVTAGGIDMNYPYPDPNANRLKVRSADNAGDGIFQHECKFPFKYEGIEYYDCILKEEDRPWCATLVDAEKNYLSGDWGYCLPEDEELVPRGNITATGEKSGYESLHVCKAQANYGGIEVDWDNSVIQLYLFTPHATNAVAGKVTIGI